MKNKSIFGDPRKKLLGQNLDFKSDGLPVRRFFKSVCGRIIAGTAQEFFRCNFRI